MTPRAACRRYAGASESCGGMMRMAPLRRGSANVNEALLMKRSKYYIRIMHPTFERAILTVEATSTKQR
jgi:hypothetical protein